MSAAKSNAIVPNVSNCVADLPLNSAGPINRNTPPKPISKPMIARQLGLMPLGLNASNNTSHSGIVLIIKDAMPDGTRCSAHESTPLLQSKSAMPTIAVEIHCLLVGAASPAMRRHAKRIAPAIRKRKPADINGGIVSTVNRIARYVEPQTI